VRQFAVIPVDISILALCYRPLRHNCLHLATFCFSTGNRWYDQSVQDRIYDTVCHVNLISERLSYLVYGRKWN